MSETVQFIIHAYWNFQSNRHQAGEIENDDFENVEKLVKEAFAELKVLKQKAAALDAYREKVQAMGEG